MKIMRNQKGIGAIVIVIVVAITLLAGGAIFVLRGKGKETAKNDSTANGVNENQVSFKACELISAEDVTTALGEVYTMGTQVGVEFSKNGEIQTQCSYSHDAEKIQDVKSVTIMIKRHPSAEVTKSNFEAGKTTAPVTTTINGYGDEAYWSDEGKQMLVRKGNYWLLIVPDESNQSDAKKLAELTLKKLP